MNFLPYNNCCPSCGRDFYTLIEQDKFKVMLNRNFDFKVVFDRYPLEYIRQLSLGFCGECQCSEKPVCVYSEVDLYKLEKLLVSYEN